jgi:ABC-type hemin transport system substrate-binding protein
MMVVTILQLNDALDRINEAIEILAKIDGMEQYAEQLNLQAVEIEQELDELESVLDSEEPDPGEMVEWHDFDPDC